MLQIQHVSKVYRTGDLVQKALNDVSLNLRDNEFISILGPSGSGKTTLLNIIGGLDRYDSGDMIIDGISTKMYHARAWDSYRNHAIGFVFQSYNLIPHQSVLANVELALTIGGIKGKDRRQRALDALREVGLEEHIHKRPNQLSGGQMQRVAIARALVNDPKILLADEPTGALDTETGLQVMEILKKVAEKRLVVMVTHNPELAEQYSTRIVRLRDGKIIDDSNPYTVPETAAPGDAKAVTFGKSKMSFLTSLSLSFNNLKTKKGRTIITAGAGSIGIVGIALILALTSGVNEYIVELQKSTIESYPIVIDSVAYSYTFMDDTEDDAAEIAPVEGKVTARAEKTVFDSDLFEQKTKKNNLKKFKAFLDDPANGADQYIGTGTITSSYNLVFNGYVPLSDGTYRNTSSYLDSTGAFHSSDYYMSDGYIELPRGRDDAIISKKTLNDYMMIYGQWPEKEDECVLFVDEDGTLSAEKLCQLNLISSEDYAKLCENPSLAGKDGLGVVSYEDICKMTLKILPAFDRYVKKDSGTYRYVEDTDNALQSIIKTKGYDLKVVGIVQSNANSMDITSATSWGTKLIGYNYLFTQKMIENCQKADVIVAQMEDDTKSVITGLPFDKKDDKALAAYIRTMMKEKTDSEKANLLYNLSEGSFSDLGAEATEKTIAQKFDEKIDALGDKELIQFYTMYNYDADNFNDTLDQIGYVNENTPSSIVIYPDTFDGKQGIMNLLEIYNADANENDRIEYNDYFALITEQLTSMINTISFILIAFVAVSLVVSCIMIGIITHISVLERTKEIGILRALGASKRNISSVFNAETFIIGFLAGLIGIVVAALLCIPANLIIGSLLAEENTAIKIAVPILPALLLLGVSTLITMIGGFIPAKSASRKDPVVALRTE